MIEPRRGISMEPKPVLKKMQTHWFCYNSAYYKMKTGEKSEEIEERKAREFMAKYMANYGAHRKGMTPSEVTEYYDKWAENRKYEEDLDPETYHGPAIAAEAVGEVFRDWRDRIKLIDVACGTGYVGEELYKVGFRIIDGVDPSEGMLDICRKKNVYTNLYQEFVTDAELPIEEGIYDGVVVSGGLGEGHLPCSSMSEMIRLVRPGGYVVLVMRKEYLKYVDEYTGRLEPAMEQLHRDAQWEMMEKKEVKHYSFERQGLVYKFKVRKGLTDGEIEKARRLEKQKEKERQMALQQQQQQKK